LLSPQFGRCRRVLGERVALMLVVRQDSSH
jgi:hypothetical protein